MATFDYSEAQKGQKMDKRTKWVIKQSFSCHNKKKENDENLKALYTYRQNNVYINCAYIIGIFTKNLAVYL